MWTLGGSEKGKLGKNESLAPKDFLVMKTTGTQQTLVNKMDKVTKDTLNKLPQND